MNPKKAVITGYLIEALGKISGGRIPVHFAHGLVGREVLIEKYTTAMGAEGEVAVALCRPWANSKLPLAPIPLAALKMLRNDGDKPVPWDKCCFTPDGKFVHRPAAPGEFNYSMDID